MFTGQLRPKFMRNRGFRDRLFQAWTYHQLRMGGQLSQEWLAGEVSRRLGLKVPLTQSGVSRWLRGSVPKDLRTIVVLSQALRVDPGWLAFGDDSKAPTPVDPMSLRMHPRPETD
jgi:transcriptional regulator with XRE-family HTH domain